LPRLLYHVLTAGVNITESISIRAIILRVPPTRHLQRVGAWGIILHLTRLRARKHTLRTHARAGDRMMGETTQDERSYFIWTVGCQMNVADSNYIGAALEGRVWRHLSWHSPRLA